MDTIDDGDIIRLVVNNRQKYTAEVEKLMHQCTILKVKQLKKDAEHLQKQLKAEDVIEIPTTNIFKNPQREVSNQKQETKLKNSIIQQIHSMQTIIKMKNCPIAQQVAEL